METGRPTGNAALEHLTVLVADDDVAFRRSVCEALEAGGFVVVGAVGNATSATAVAGRLQPDICLIEVELPGDGLSAIGRIAKRSPDTFIVVLSRSERAEDVVGAFTHGASGYLLKGITGEMLASTLRGVYRGGPPLSRSLVPHLVAEIRRSPVRQLMLPAGPVTLTPREWEVGQLLRDGHSTMEIADRLGVSPVTVRRHVGLLLKKLGASSREAAVALLRAYGRH